MVSIQLQKVGVSFAGSGDVAAMAKTPLVIGDSQSLASESGSGFSTSDTRATPRPQPSDRATTKISLRPNGCDARMRMPATVST